jgi:hypothetical protein
VRTKERAEVVGAAQRAAAQSLAAAQTLAAETAAGCVCARARSWLRAAPSSRTLRGGFAPERTALSLACSNSGQIMCTACTFLNDVDKVGKSRKCRMCKHPIDPAARSNAPPSSDAPPSSAASVCLCV